MRAARPRIPPRTVPWPTTPDYVRGLVANAAQLASGQYKPADWDLKRIERYFVLELALRQTYGLTLGLNTSEHRGIMECALDRLRDPIESKGLTYARTLLRRSPDEGGWPLVDVECQLGKYLHDTCYMIARAGLAQPVSA